MFYALSDLGLLKVQGKEAAKFLQGQLTCDVGPVTSGLPALGAHCNPQGRVISLFYLFFYQDAYYLLMQHDMVPITIASLKKYSIFFKVELISCINLVVIGEVHPASKPTITMMADLPQLSMTQIAVSPSRSIGVLDQAISSYPLQPLSMQITSKEESIHQWKLMNIADGIPTIYPETTGKFFPHEIHLDHLNAIHFTKGCYTGQEIIARTHYRGKSKNHLYTACLMSNIPPQPGSDILSMQQGDITPCGMVVEIAKDLSQENFLKYHILILANDVCATTQPLYWDRNKKIELTHLTKIEKKEGDLCVS